MKNYSFLLALLCCLCFISCSQEDIIENSSDDLLYVDKISAQDYDFESLVFPVSFYTRSLEEYDLSYAYRVHQNNNNDLVLDMFPSYEKGMDNSITVINNLDGPIAVIYQKCTETDEDGNKMISWYNQAGEPIFDVNYNTQTHLFTLEALYIDEYGGVMTRGTKGVLCDLAMNGATSIWSTAIGMAVGTGPAGVAAGVVCWLGFTIANHYVCERVENAY